MRKLGKYELLGELGRGAFGIVYRARDPIINRMVALKTITTGLADNPNLLERFYREAQSAGSLQHPNIITVYEMGDEAGTPFIAMEFVDGHNLGELIAKRSPLPIALKLTYALQTCQALDYAHKRGIIHRDVKPGNVMVNKEGTVKVVDFGIARVLEASMTRTGILIGTFAYMAPELYDGAHAAERSDIWSFGVLLYEFLAYRAPFFGETAAALMQSILRAEPAPLRQFAPDCPEDLESVVHRMLRKSEAERFQTMGDLLLELGPIFKRLQTETLTAILAQTRQLVELGEYEPARDLLRQAIQMDATNVQVRVLSEKVNAELKRLSVRPQVQQHVEKGRALLQEGKLQEASTEAGNALRLDSQFGPARELQQQIQREIDRAQLVNECLQSAKQALIEGLPDEAQSLLLKVQEADPSNQQLPALQQQVREEKERRERRLQLREGMQQARSLWTQRQYRECIDALTRLQQAFPGEDEILRLLETAREDQAEHNKQEKLAEARDSLSARRYEECIALLTKLQQEFPRDEEIQRSLETAREEQVVQAKQKAVDQARQLLAAWHYEECIALLTGLQQDFPEDDEISRLLATAREDQAEQNRRAKLAQARSLLAARQYQGCLVVLTELQKELPHDEEIARLLETARQEQTEQNKQEKLAEARKLLAARHYEECIALLTTLEERFAGENEVRRLLEIARLDQAAQSKRVKLAEARKLLSARRYEECIAMLVQVQQDLPDDDETARLLENAREAQAEQDRKQKLSAAKDLLAAERFADSLAVLDPLLAADAKDSAVLKLRTLVLREQQKQAKAETFRREWELLKGLASQKAYSELVARGEALLRDFPGDADLVRLVEFARGEQAKIENDLRLRAALDQVQQFLQASRFSEASAAARAGLASFPGNAELAALLEQAEAREKKEAVRQFIERRIREIRGKINRGELSDAKELARETLITAGPDTDVGQLLASAEVEYDAREKRSRQEQKLETVRALIRSGNLAAAATTLDGIIQSGDFDPLDPRLYEVAEQIATAREAAAVAATSVVTAKPESPAREYAVLEGPPVSAVDPSAAATQAMQPTGAAPEATLAPPAVPPEGQPTVILPANAAARAELTQADVDRAARQLARHIGPIARVLARRAAQHADSLRALYFLLAEELDGKAERARFLRDAGFSDS